MNKPSLLALALSLALAGAQAHAAELIPINFDGAGEGYNDPTPAAPVGGNPGTTVGEQRMIVAQFAADMWGSVLQSNQPIYIGAQFNPLGANVLGSAGATFVFSDFPGAGVPATWYSSALADALSGVDQAPGYIDINSQFSSDFAFYYGLDGNTPAGQVNFLDVVTHEFGHGVGFQNFENEATGAFLSGQQDIYSTFTFDNTTGKRWTQMTVAERAASGVNYGNVIFDGASAVRGAGLILGPRTTLRVTAPAGIAGDYEYGTASFGAAVSPSNFNGTVVIGLDAANASGPTTTDGCTAFTNAAAVAGHIALMDRGTCGFAVKAKNAQLAGASGVIIANNAVTNPPPGMGGTDPTVTVPSIMITQADGVKFKANLPSVTFVVDTTKLQGADNLRRPRLYMPNPVSGGSSGSHYDTALSPNALMEPAINTSLRSAWNLDITPNLLKDTGWVLNTGNAKIKNCDTLVKVVNDAGIALGANVQASSNVCENSSVDHAAYMTCMTAYKQRMVAAHLISPIQASKIMSCATLNQ
jgi:hypothetical protein